MENVIENYINGNLTDAKRQAKRYGARAIRERLLEYGYTLVASVAIADFLKGDGSFQAACDAQYAGRES